MATNLSRYKGDLEKLIALGEQMHTDLASRHLLTEGKLDAKQEKRAKELDGTFEREYQRWYTEAHAVVRQLIPARLPEFEQLYKGDVKRKDTTIQTYHIQDWLNGVRSGIDWRTSKKHYDDIVIVVMRFTTQFSILKAVESRFESTLHDIRQLVQADLFDSEIDAATELSKNGFLRAAGAITGVVLEKHLGQVATNHNISSRKQHPTISDFNDLLKQHNVLDVPAWRNIQRLGDLRNLCNHDKQRDPTPEEIDELVIGVEKITKTLF